MMHPAYAAYNALGTGAFCLLFPAYALLSGLRGRYRKEFRQRMGIYPRRLFEGGRAGPRIWLHAASVGEVGVGAAVIGELVRIRPDCHITLSTTTENGLAIAKKKLADTAACVYAPVDFIASVRNALRRVRPDVLALIETEIWPNWLIQAHRKGIRTAIVNGRISVRSIRGYLKARPIIKETLRHVDTFSMIHPSDGDRIHRIGAPRNKIAINGNAKYDLLIKRADPRRLSELKRIYNLSKTTPVLVAGSTRNGEEERILDAFRDISITHKEAVLIIAPRHPERTRAILNMTAERGFACQLRTDLERVDRNARVVILNTMGELTSVYGLASAAFCGGSLVPLGGQNVLEAAVWGVPVLYGPSMEDFQDAKDLLDRFGGGIQVGDETELAERVNRLLADPDRSTETGRRARAAVESHAGAAVKHAAVICDLLDRSDRLG